MSKVSVLVGMLFASVSVGAFADGPESAYDHGDPAVARTLSPNEYLINADGAQEDPQHRMSDAARAYRNGLIAGRKEEAEREAKVPPLPPLPHTVSEDDNSRYTSIPPQAQPQPQPQPRAYAQVPRPPIHVPQQQTVAYQPVQQPQPQPQAQMAWQPPQPVAYAQPRQVAYQQPPVQYVETQNVYTQSGFNYTPVDDPRTQAYAPPPATVYVASADPEPAQYVYEQPAPSAPVMIVQPRRAYRAVPVRYWQPGYVTRYGDQPAYAYSYYQSGW